MATERELELVQIQLHRMVEIVVVVHQPILNLTLVQWTVSGLTLFTVHGLMQRTVVELEREPEVVAIRHQQMVEIAVVVHQRILNLTLVQ